MRGMRRPTARALLLLLAGAPLAVLACADEERSASNLAPPTPPTPPTSNADGSASPLPPPEPPAAPPTGIIRFERVSTAELSSPIELVVHDGKRYVVEQGGAVRILSADGATHSTAIDLAGSIVSGGEAGLLGLAFHPQFAKNGYVFLYFTEAYASPKAGFAFKSVLARFHSSDAGLTFEPASKKIILEVDQPYANHNGATIAFGPDGYLYWGLGDGGSGGDPENRAQNKSELLGKMLRIDVDGADPYAIPADNPYADGDGGRPEIYALGLRNPYRFRFDDETGVLWAGDVGQSAREEVDKIVLGGNYGWNVREGKICYPSSSPCGTEGFLDPVVDHGRNEATSITGGLVYRGAAVPAIQGKYVYADFGQQTFWAIAIDEAAPKAQRLDDGANRPLPAAFALDTDGELLVLDIGGAVWRVAAGVDAGK